MTKGFTTTLVMAGVLLSAASTARAQTPAQPPAPRPATQPPPQEPGWLGDSLPPLWNRVFVNISAARQLHRSTIDVVNTFSSFDETGSFQTSQNVGLGLLFDGSAGYRLTKYFAVGGGLWATVARSAIAGTAAMPDPLYYGRPAVKNLTAEDLSQKTIGVDLQLVLTAPIGSRLSVSAFIGPSIIHTKLDVGSWTFAAPAQTSTSGSQATAASAQGPTIVVDKQSDTTTRAGMAGLDITFMFTERAGVGVLGRYVHGTANLLIAPEMKIGGTQVGAGLRYRF